MAQYTHTHTLSHLGLNSYLSWLTCIEHCGCICVHDSRRWHSALCSSFQPVPTPLHWTWQLFGFSLQLWVFVCVSVWVWKSLFNAILRCGSLEHSANKIQSRNVQIFPADVSWHDKASSMCVCACVWACVYASVWERDCVMSWCVVAEFCSHTQVSWVNFSTGDTNVFSGCR